MTTNNPLISVIIPVYNCERYLAEAIQSVLAQDYRPIEVIVVDDGSTDKSREIAGRFTGSVRYFYKYHSGASTTLNQGISLSSGEFFAFLDADDLWMPDKLSSQMPYLINRPEIQYVVAKTKFFLQEGNALPYGFKKELLNGDHVAYLTGTLLARKSLFNNIGNFNVDLSIAYDVDWFNRAKDRSMPVAVVPKVLLHKRIHGTNISSNIDLNNEELLKIIEKSIKHRDKEKRDGCQ